MAVHHRLDGPADAPALVLSGSLGSTLAMWEPQVEALAGLLRIVRYDHRGHGGSPAPADPYTLADLGADALALLDSLALDRAHFCGLSLGGMVGMWLAAHHPERVARLVLCCTAASLPGEVYAERAAAVRARGSGSIAQAVVERWFTPAWRTRNPEATARWRAMIAATPAEGYAGCCDAIATMALEDLLGRIAAPTLVIAGAEDPAAPPARAAHLVAAIPDARLAVIPDAAHLANVEQAARVTQLILSHVSAEAP